MNERRRRKNMEIFISDLNLISQAELKKKFSIIVDEWDWFNY